MREMKDSGVEWIGEIPKDWEISSFKRVFSFDKGLPITKENLVDSGIPVLSYGQIHSKSNSGIRLTDDLLRYVSEEYLTTNPSSLAQHGDILFADTSEDYEGIGNCAYISTDAPIFAGYHTIITRPKDIDNPQYLAFLFQTDNWRSQLRSSASGIKVFTISQTMLKKTTVVIPSSQTQHRIADYLDAKCAQIDRAIARQQEVIEKLKEYKLSVITEAVTKGLNPDVPMKDSGIEWIGEIPEHWEVQTIGKLAKVTSSTRVFEEDYTDEGIPFFRSKEIVDLSKGAPIVTELYVSQDTFRRVCSKSPAPAKGDMLLTSIGTIGQTWISDGREFYYKDGNITQIVQNDRFNMFFLKFCFTSNVIFEQYNRLAMGSTLLALTIVKIKRLVFPVPPLEEQRMIAHFLEIQCDKIERGINEKQLILNKLTEYKKSLIYEVVTGKREV